MAACTATWANTAGCCVSPIPTEQDPMKSCGPCTETTQIYTSNTYTGAEDDAAPDAVRSFTLTIKVLQEMHARTRAPRAGVRHATGDKYDSATIDSDFKRSSSTSGPQRDAEQCPKPRTGEHGKGGTCCTNVRRLTSSLPTNTLTQLRRQPRHLTTCPRCALRVRSGGARPRRPHLPQQGHARGPPVFRGVRAVLRRRREKVPRAHAAPTGRDGRCRRR